MSASLSEPRNLDNVSWRGWTSKAVISWRLWPMERMGLQVLWIGFNLRRLWWHPECRNLWMFSSRQNWCETLLQTSKRQTRVTLKAHASAWRPCSQFVACRPRKSSSFSLSRQTSYPTSRARWRHTWRKCSLWLLVMFGVAEAWLTSTGWEFWNSKLLVGM